MIHLKCKGHDVEYELMQLIHLFNPYVKESYLIEANCQETQLKVKLFLEGIERMSVERQIDLITDIILNKKIIKDSLKRMIYEILTKLTGHKMPWGILTGIRPTKIVHEYLEERKPEQLIRTILEEDYHISPSKVDLLMQVAKQERDILIKNKPNEMSLYIGIPFCPTRCVYCSFTAYSIEHKKNLVEPYLNALYKEIDYIADAKKNTAIRSLYIGGGTPTSLSERQLEELLTHIKERFDLEAIEEYTVEAGRPDTITKQKLQIMKDLGVNRISINPQTMNQKTLDAIGRCHTIDEIRKVFYWAREIGHQNINMDMIIGLPNETISDVENTLIELSKLKPDNITIHTMAIKRASRLREEKETYHLSQKEAIEEMLVLCERYMQQLGLMPYYLYRQKNMLGNFENVGYAKRGKECVYNIEIMEEKQTIVALGAGAITKIVYQNGERIDRVPNVKSLEDYIRRIDEMITRKKQGFEIYQ